MTDSMFIWQRTIYENIYKKQRTIYENIYKKLTKNIGIGAVSDIYMVKG